MKGKDAGARVDLVSHSHVCLLFLFFEFASNTEASLLHGIDENFQKDSLCRTLTTSATDRKFKCRQKKVESDVRQKKGIMMAQCFMPWFPSLLSTGKQRF